MATQEQTETQEAPNNPEVKEEEPKVDLITRVSQVKTKAPDDPTVPDKDGKFNINELDSKIESIEDQALKEQFVKLKKSLLSGENKKYEEIANLRKQYEARLAESSANWTPERLKQELNKPDFVQAANSVLQTGSPTPQQGDDQYSALSDEEKAELVQLKQKITTLEQSSWQAVKQSQDTQLKDKYANYDPNSIDQVASDLVSGKVKATREDLWKVVDYERAVQRAYDLGLTDKKEQNQERVNGMSFDGGGNHAAPNTVQRQEGETTQQFMRRSYVEHTKAKK